jgi:phytoene dehydrogenase-like protein
MASTRAIVIGTGAGGMAAAAYLAKAGLEVTALEQGEHLGGYSNPFYRQGFQFDPGIHYVGECRPGGSIHGVLAGIDVDATALFAELDPDGFDVYRFPDLEIRMCRGLDRYRERLEAAFPRQARRLARFFELIHSFQVVARAMQTIQVTGPGLSLLRALPHLPRALRWMTRSYGELLGSLFDDARLRAVLAAPGGDVGLPPGRTAALVGLLLIAHYADGAFFPRGGSGAFRDALVGAAERHGASFRTGARVERIRAREGRAVGVTLVGGEELDAEVVVSDVDPVITYGRLLEPAVVPPSLQEKVRKTEPSLGSFGVYLGMRRDLAQHGLGRLNVWDYPSWDLDALYAPVFAGRLPSEPFFFLSPNSLKADPGALAPPGASTLEIITMAPYELFERWRDRPVRARGPEYEAEKRRVRDWLLEGVERRWPGLVGDVVVEEVSTPLTNESYTLAVRGGAYGPPLTPEQWGWRRFGPTTPLLNLFLAGAGVFGDGIAQCLASGRLAAQRALRAVAPRARRWRAQSPKSQDSPAW